MIKSHLKIGNGPILNMADSHGMVYVSSDSILSAPLKSFEETSYPEQEGANINPKTVEDAFDYTVKFYVRADGSLGNANKIISDFNKKLHNNYRTLELSELSWSMNAIDGYFYAELSDSDDDGDDIPASMSISGYTTISWNDFENNLYSTTPTNKVVALKRNNLFLYDDSYETPLDLVNGLNGVDVVYLLADVEVKTYNQVTFYNDYKRVKIVGYPNQISEATDFWRDSKNNTHDIVLVEWKIRVNKPSLCNFSLTDSEISSLEPQEND